MDGQKPSLGRIVIYTFPDSALPSKASARQCPAIITAVWSNTCVNLRLLRDYYQEEYAGRGTSTSVNFDPEEKGHSWNWPARV